MVTYFSFSNCSSHSSTQFMRLLACAFISSSKQLLIGNLCTNQAYIQYIYIYQYIQLTYVASALDIPFYSLFLSISSPPRPPLTSPASQAENNPRIEATRHRQPPCTCRRCRHRGSSAVLQGPSRPQAKRYAVSIVSFNVFYYLHTEYDVSSMIDPVPKWK